MSTTTANMSLIIPDVGDSNYPSSVSSSLNTLDSHTHASGSGVQIPTGGIADLAVTTAKLAGNSVTTAKILDANVTKAKLTAVGQQVSSSSGSFFTASTTAVDVTNLTVSITTTGRPVIVGLIADGTVSPSSSEILVGATPGNSVNGHVVILRGATEVAHNKFVYSSTGGEELAFPASSINHLDAVAAGTYTYKIQVYVGTVGSINMTNIKMFAYEL